MNWYVKTVSESGQSVFILVSPPRVATLLSLLVVTRYPGTRKRYSRLKQVKRFYSLKNAMGTPRKTGPVVTKNVFSNSEPPATRMVRSSGEVQS